MKKKKRKFWCSLIHKLEGVALEWLGNKRSYKEENEKGKTFISDKCVLEEEY